MQQFIKKKLFGFIEILNFKNKNQLIINRVFFKSNPLNVYLMGKFKILVDHEAGDENGVRLVITSPMYKLFLKHIKKKSEISVFDIGANVGGFPLMLEINKYKIKKLVSVEFNPLTFTRLNFNILYNLNCIYRGVNVALGGNKRTLTTYIGSNGGTSATVIDNIQKKGDRPFEIEMVTFDEIYYTFDCIVSMCRNGVLSAESCYQRLNQAYFKS